MLPVQETQIQSLVGELRSCMPPAPKKNLKKKKGDNSLLKSFYLRIHLWEPSSYSPWICNQDRTSYHNYLRNCVNTIIKLLPVWLCGSAFSSLCLRPHLRLKMPSAQGLRDEGSWSVNSLEITESHPFNRALILRFYGNVTFVSGVT